MVRSLWVVFVFGSFVFFFHCLLVVTFDLCPSMLSLALADLGMFFILAHGLFFGLFLILGCFRVGLFSNLVLFTVPLHLLIALGICHLDSGGPIVFASRSGVSVSVQSFGLLLSLLLYDWSLGVPL